MSKEEKKVNEETVNVTIEASDGTPDPVGQDVFDTQTEAQRNAEDLNKTGKTIEPEAHKEIVIKPEFEKLPAVNLSEDHIKIMTQRFKTSAKIRVHWNSSEIVGVKEERLVYEILRYINYFNMLNEDTTLVFGRSIDSISVINEFVPFLRPMSVRVNVLDRRGKNLLVPSRHDASWDEDGDGFSLDEFENLQIRFRNILRKDADSDKTSLSVAMKATNMFDLMDVVSCEGKCASYTNPFVPVKINSAVGELFVKNRYYNIYQDSIIEDYLMDWLK